tara:strand:- start:2966 stop:3208 length:243 start_codon:yes stop_codon:yes gene_type:complete
VVDVPPKFTTIKGLEFVVLVPNKVTKGAWFGVLPGWPAEDSIVENIISLKAPPWPSLIVIVLLLADGLLLTTMLPVAFAI